MRLFKRARRTDKLEIAFISLVHSRLHLQVTLLPPGLSIQHQQEPLGTGRTSRYLGSMLGQANAEFDNMAQGLTRPTQPTEDLESQWTKTKDFFQLIPEGTEAYIFHDGVWKDCYILDGHYQSNEPPLHNVQLLDPPTLLDSVTRKNIKLKSPHESPPVPRQLSSKEKENLSAEEDNLIRVPWKEGTALARIIIHAKTSTPNGKHEVEYIFEVLSKTKQSSDKIFGSILSTDIDVVKGGLTLSNELIAENIVYDRCEWEITKRERNKQLKQVMDQDRQYWESNIEDDNSIHSSQLPSHNYIDDAIISHKRSGRQTNQNINTTGTTYTDTVDMESNEEPESDGATSATTAHQDQTQAQPTILPRQSHMQARLPRALPTEAANRERRDSHGIEARRQTNLTEFNKDSIIAQERAGTGRPIITTEWWVLLKDISAYNHNTDQELLSGESLTDYGRQFGNCMPKGSELDLMGVVINKPYADTNSNTRLSGFLIYSPRTTRGQARATRYPHAIMTKIQDSLHNNIVHRTQEMCEKPHPLAGKIKERLCPMNNHDYEVRFIFDGMTTKFISPNDILTHRQLNYEIYMNVRSLVPEEVKKTHFTLTQQISISNVVGIQPFRIRKDGKQYVLFAFISHKSDFGKEIAKFYIEAAKNNEGKTVFAGGMPWKPMEHETNTAPKVREKYYKKLIAKHTEINNNYKSIRIRNLGPQLLQPKLRNKVLAGTNDSVGILPTLQLGREDPAYWFIFYHNLSTVQLTAIKLERTVRRLCPELGPLPEGNNIFDAELATSSSTSIDQILFGSLSTHIDRTTDNTIQPFQQTAQPQHSISEPNVFVVINGRGGRQGANIYYSWEGQYQAKWVVTGVSGSIYKKCHSPAAGVVAFQQYFPMIKCIDDITKLHKLTHKDETNNSNPSPYIIPGTDPTKEYTFYHECSPELKAFRDRVTKIEWFETFPIIPPLTISERRRAGLLPSSSSTSSPSTINNDQSTNQQTTNHITASVTQQQTQAPLLQQAPRQPSQRPRITSTTQRSGKITCDELSHTSSRTSMDRKRIKTTTTRRQKKDCVVFTITETFSTLGVIQYIDNHFNVDASEYTLSLFAQPDQNMRVVAHFTDPTRAEHLFLGMQGVDRNINSPACTPFEATLCTHFKTPQICNVGDMDQPDGNVNPWCPFTNCAKHWRFSRSTNQIFQDAEERGEHLWKYHLQAIRHADPELMESHSIMLCHLCEDHISPTHQALDEHIEEVCPAASANSSQDMDTEVQSHTSKNSTSQSSDENSDPYHESQDTDFYKYIRAQCPFPQKAILEQMIYDQATHGEILQKLFEWRAAADRQS